MFPYWILFSLGAAGAILYRPNGRWATHGGPALPFLAVFMLLMIGFRYDVGGDWRNYLEIFDYIGFFSFGQAATTSDPGYALLNWSAHQIGAEIWLVNLVCAAIFVWGLFAFARQQPNPWLVLVVAIPYLVIVVAMGYSRQGVAIGLILGGLASINRTQSIVRFSAWVVLAAAFHKSAIVILPLVAFAATRNRLIMVGIAVAMGMMLWNLFLSGDIDRLVAVYVEAEYSSQGALIRVAMNLPPAVLFLAYQKRFGLNEFNRKLWRNFALAALGALGLLVFTESTTVVDRLALYLIPLQLLVLGRLPFAFSDRGRENAAMALGVIAYSALVQLVWLNYADNAHYWLPYQYYSREDLWQS